DSAMRSTISITRSRRRATGAFRRDSAISSRSRPVDPNLGSRRIARPRSRNDAARTSRSWGATSAFAIRTPRWPASSPTAERGRVRLVAGGLDPVAVVHLGRAGREHRIDRTVLERRELDAPSDRGLLDVRAHDLVGEVHAGEHLGILGTLGRLDVDDVALQVL